MNTLMHKKKKKKKKKNLEKFSFVNYSTTCLHVYELYISEGNVIKTKLINR